MTFIDAPPSAVAPDFVSTAMKQRGILKFVLDTYFTVAPPPLATFGRLLSHQLRKAVVSLANLYSPDDIVPYERQPDTDVDV